jgi:ribonuclease P protein component
MAIKQTFKKEERLSGKKSIAALFEEGKGFFVYPFKVVFLKVPESRPFPASVLVSVSKRNFKKAVDRNRIKRLIREAYRQNKSILGSNLESQPESLLLGFIYTAKTIMEYKEIERKIILILQRLIKGDAKTAG